MKIITTSWGEGRAVRQYSSQGFTLSPILKSKGGVQVAATHLAPGGRIGRHPAASGQLLLVIKGEGEASGDDGAFQTISEGQAVFWETGEEHETRTDVGLMALVIEGEDILPMRE